MADDAETTDATKEAEEVDATQAHTADREGVAEHYEEMSDRGAKAKGEGKID